MMNPEQTDERSPPHSGRAGTGGGGGSPRAGLSVADVKRLTARKIAVEMSEGVRPGAVALTLEELTLQTRLREESQAVKAVAPLVVDLRSLGSGGILQPPAPAPPPAPPMHVPPSLPPPTTTPRQQLPPQLPILVVNPPGTPTGFEGGARRVSRLHHHPYLNLTHYHYHANPHHHGPPLDGSTGSPNTSLSSNTSGAGGSGSGSVFCGKSIHELTLQELYQAITDLTP